MNNIEIRGVRPANINDKGMRDIVMSCLEILNVSTFSLEIDFVLRPKMQAINKKYRSIDQPTDVLSFPQENIPGQKKRILGNIIIAFDVVQEKEEQIDDVIKHGLLHLLGYDHELSDEKWETAAHKIKCNL